MFDVSFFAVMAITLAVIALVILTVVLREIAMHFNNHP